MPNPPRKLPRKLLQSCIADGIGYSYTGAGKVGSRAVTRVSSNRIGTELQRMLCAMPHLALPTQPLDWGFKPPLEEDASLLIRNKLGCCCCEAWGPTSASAPPAAVAPSVLAREAH